mmetsp:Transcript_2808/g.4309  ORF Transcript_2808/g.4309 Transcript_2808/m.4309 type:complete len:229 (-) Transcript_2808:2-688(-)
MTVEGRGDDLSGRMSTTSAARRACCGEEISMVSPGRSSTCTDALGCEAPAVAIDGATALGNDGNNGATDGTRPPIEELIGRDPLPLCGDSNGGRNFSSGDNGECLGLPVNLVESGENPRVDAPGLDCEPIAEELTAPPNSEKPVVKPPNARCIEEARPCASCCAVSPTAASGMLLVRPRLPRLAPTPRRCGDSMALCVCLRSRPAPPPCRRRPTPLPEGVEHHKVRRA